MPVSSAGGTGNCTLAPMRRDPSGSSRVARPLRAAGPAERCSLAAHTMPHPRFRGPNAGHRTVHAAFETVEAPFRTSSAGFGSPEPRVRTSAAGLGTPEPRVRTSAAGFGSPEPRFRMSLARFKTVERRCRTREAREERSGTHKVMQPTVRKPAGSVWNRAQSSPDQRCPLAPGRRSNEKTG